MATPLTAAPTTNTTAPNGAAALFEVLRGWGVRHVFTCPGTTEVAFLDASLAYPDIAVTLTTHESIAVALADGYARITRQPTVAYLHTNVGLTNGLANLAAAHLARSPVIILNGLKAEAIQGRGGFTTAPSIRDFARQYTRWDWQTLRSDALGEDLNRALKVATTAPMGPIYIGLSQDLVETQTPVPVPTASRYRVSGEVRPDPDALARAAQLLAHAERPLLVAGGEVAASAATDDLFALAERLGAPVVAEDRRTIEIRAYPPAHAHYAGFYSPALPCVRDADVILLAGSRSFIEFEPPTTPAVPPGATVIHLASDPAELGRNYQADVALVGDARLALRDLLAALPANDAPRARPNAARDAYLATQAKARADAEQLATATPIRVPAVLQALGDLLTERTTVVADAVTASAGTLTHLLPRAGRGFHTTASGSLGWGMGAALGIQLASPEDEVIAVVGDGVFQFGIQALWTAVHDRLPVIWVVLNNASYMAVKSALQRFGGAAAARQQYPASAIPGPDIAAIARASARSASASSASPTSPSPSAPLANPAAPPSSKSSPTPTTPAPGQRRSPKDGSSPVRRPPSHVLHSPRAPTQRALTLEGRCLPTGQPAPRLANRPHW
ncbi:MAG: thiamine pyrophosphate-binding protein [Chloroflexia bacterium]